MAFNIEIKARVRNPESMRERALELSGSKPEILYQRDTFYVVPKGRLKFRERRDGAAELIYYDRPDEVGPKISNYTRIAISDPISARQCFDHFLKTSAVVCKYRQVFLIGTTRIHLDEVEGLGSFLELEVVTSENEMEAAKETALALMKLLGIRQEDLIEHAYVDLIELVIRCGGDPSLQNTS